MMRSMFSGISGLKGFQSSMDVIGNNIANVNTVGYKSSRTTFQSMLNQTVVGAKSPEMGGRGGTNAMQIGLGSQIGSISKIMTQGSFQNTGKKTDLGLQGDGFFVLSDGIQNFYTRSGNYELDENGNFVQPSTGLKLQGWISKVDPKTGKRYLDLDKPPSDLFIQAGMTMGAKATSNMDLGGNLNADVGIEPLTINVKNPDDPTKQYKVRFTFEKLEPFDTKRLFSSSTIKYTWHAEIVDWNSETPGEVPSLDATVGMVELDQFGQIQKFEKYTTKDLAGGVPKNSSTEAFTKDVIGTSASGVTFFKYSYDENTPSPTKIQEYVRDVFDPDGDGILDKIISECSFNAAASADYTFSATDISAGGSMTSFVTKTFKLAEGDVVDFSYFTYDEFAYDSEGDKQFNIKGPILDSDSLTPSVELDEGDIVVYYGSSYSAHLTTGFTYDENTGTVKITDDTITGDKIRIGYCTQESFIGDGSKKIFNLSKRAVTTPFSAGTTSSSMKVNLDFTVDQKDLKINFRGEYPDTSAGTSNDLLKYTIQYADPNSSTDLDTISVQVPTSSKPSVSIPKTGDIKFFDKNDTQNYVLGDYVAPTYTTSVRVYDSLGKPYTVYLEFQKIKDNQWAWKATEESGTVVSYVDDKEKTLTPNPNDMTSVVGGVIEFDSAGRIAKNRALHQNGEVSDENIVRIKFDPGKKVDDGAAPPPEEGATEVSMALDFSELVQFSSEFSASVTEQDGNGMGTLQNYAINTAGEVVGTFSNGKSDVLGRIAVAIFNNPAGLTEMGNTLFQVSANSGIAQIGLAGVGGRATISPGVLEMSNVDLAEEFTGMVIVQRAFQANARTVTTVDQILQELVNLKR